MEFPTNAGAIIEHTPSGTWYVRDQQGLWHNGSYSTTDSDFKDHVKCFPTHHKVVFEGLAPPTKEPKGLGAVVEFSPDKTRAVFDGSVWVARWYDGTSTNMPWDQIVECGSVTILSEGV